jgi:predicted RNA-binding Zn-ribbon protein involved in translation (DUF1610 family)
MAFTLPTSMDNLLYFTNRADGDLKVKAWVDKKQCPKCKKALMGKPLDPKTKKIKVRSTEYSCPSCGHTEEKKAHEESLEIKAIYTCPACKKSGEGTTQYKRKTYQGVPSFVIDCQHCGNKIPLTKKLRAIKGKKKVEEDVEDAE